MILHDVTRNIFLESPASAYFVDLMHDSNAQVPKFCDTTFDIITEFEQDCSSKIGLEKFRWLNSQWVDLIEGRVSQDLNYEDEDYMNGPEDNLLLYDTRDAMNRPEKTPLGVNLADKINLIKMCILHSITHHI